MKTKSRIASISMLIGGVAAVLIPAASFAADAKATPESVYMKYHSVLIKAKSVDDVTPFMVSGRVKEVQATPKEERALFFGFIRDTCPKDVHIVSSKIDGDTASLKLIVGDGKPQILERPMLGKVKEETVGTCTMVMQDGEWKVDKESWKSSSVSVDSEGTPIPLPKEK